MADRLRRDADKARKDDADRRWKTDVRREYLETMRDHAKYMEDLAIQIGLVGGVSRRLALKNLERVKKAADMNNLEKFSRLPESVVDSAALLDPRLVHGLVRELGMRRLEALGRGDNSRLAWQERKKLYKEFASITAAKIRVWSVDLFFDDLDAKAMQDVMAAVRQSEEKGFRSLNEYQRALILDAGAEDYFCAKAGIKR